MQLFYLVVLPEMRMGVWGGGSGRLGENGEWARNGNRFLLGNSVVYGYNPRKCEKILRIVPQ